MALLTQLVQQYTPSTAQSATRTCHYHDHCDYNKIDNMPNINLYIYFDCIFTLYAEFLQDFVICQFSLPSVGHCVQYGTCVVCE